MAYFNRDRGSSRGGGGGFRRNDFGGRGGDRGDRQMFDAICSNCGKACQVPFRPSGDKPVYCSDCFEKMGGRDRDREPRFDRPQAAPRVDTQFKTQLDVLNIKLDKIISLLEPKVETKVEEIVKIAPKTKKVSPKKK